MHRTKRRLSFALLIIMILAALLGVPAFAFMTTPLRQPDLSPWGFIAYLSDLPADGEPRLLPVCVPNRDAWTRHPDRSAGAVFVRRVPDKRQVLALERHHHGGLRVGVKYDEQARVYQSCWGIRFDLDGRELADERFRRIGDRMEPLPVRLISDEVYVNLDRPRQTIASGLAPE